MKIAEIQTGPIAWLVVHVTDRLVVFRHEYTDENGFRAALDGRSAAFNIEHVPAVISAMHDVLRHVGQRRRYYTGGGRRPTTLRLAMERVRRWAKL